MSDDTEKFDAPIKRASRASTERGKKAVRKPWAPRQC